MHDRRLALGKNIIEEIFQIALGKAARDAVDDARPFFFERLQTEIKKTVDGIEADIFEMFAGSVQVVKTSE